MRGTGDVLRFSSLVATPVSVPTATMTSGSAASLLRFVFGIQNRTGGSIYYAMGAQPADTTTMIEITGTTTNTFWLTSNEMCTGQLWLYQSQGSTKTVHVIEGT